MAKQFDQKRWQVRERIAQQAAKLMAENGINDFSLAKRKAARQLGIDDANSLPGNQEIEAALREYHAIYQQDEQRERILALRRQALQVMSLLERFNPYLTGPVLAGTATRHVAVTLSLFTESDKEVELFLLSQHIDYVRGEKRLRIGGGQRMLPSFVIEGDPALVEVLVWPLGELKALPRRDVGDKSLSRAGLAQVRQLAEGGG